MDTADGLLELLGSLVQPVLGAVTSTGSLDSEYPHLVAWVRQYGWVEIGPSRTSPALVRACCDEGIVWEGAEEYSSVKAALVDLDEHLKPWVAHHVRSRS